MGTATRELVTLIDRLIENYAPFAQPGNQWREGGEPLDALVASRDQALEDAQPLLERMKELWAVWESEQPTDADRAEVGQARNRLVSLGLEVSRNDIMLERVLTEKVAKLKTEASESNRKSQASQAYGRARMGSWLG
jgi:hypothetical protein